MEIAQGNSVYNYLKQTKISFLFFSKADSRKVKQALSRVWHHWEGRGYKERV
jgi:hypothetical protein